MQKDIIQSNFDIFRQICNEQLNLNETINNYCEKNTCDLTFEKKNLKIKKNYNNCINKIVKEKPGVYIIGDNVNNIVYIGMAGKFNSLKKEFTTHTLKKRLVASRTKEPKLKNKNDKSKDISTFDWLKNHLNICPNLLELYILVIYTNQNTLPAFIESTLIQNYFTRNKNIPYLNINF